MRTWKRRSIWKLWVMAFLVVPLAGMTATPLPVKAEVSQMTEDVAVTVVIDSSGSMLDSDPGKLSLQATNLLIDLLSPTDHIGVIRFSNDAKEVLPMQTVGEAGKETLKQQLNNQFPSEGATDYVSALKLASQQLETAPYESEKIIIFLTDGYPEPMLPPGVETYDKAAYAKQVQATVDAVGNTGITIYPIGFGESDGALLQQVAEDTKGEAFLLSSPAEIASAFLGVLTDTKQRAAVELMEESQGEHQLVTIPIPDYTDQLVALVLSDDPKLEVAIEGEGKETQGVFLDVRNGYALLTFAGERQEDLEEIQLKIKSKGTVQVAATRDVLLQPHLLAPEQGLQHGLGEPLKIAVTFKETLPAGTFVEARMYRNGIPDLRSYPLQEKEGKYSYTYTHTDEPGDYEVVVSLRNGEGEIASRSAQFTVKDIPVIKNDAQWDGKIFKKGAELLVTGFLEKQNIRMTHVQDLDISQFQLILIDSQEQESKIQLSDDPAQGTGDLIMGDGLYTVKHTFPEVGRYTAYFKVEGSYKGEPFLLKEEAGTFEVGGRGVLQFASGTEPGRMDSARNVHVTIQAENHSVREEIVRVSVPEAVGALAVKELVLPPDFEGTRELVIHLKEGVTPSTLELSLQPRDHLTVVDQGSQLSIPLNTQKGTLQERSRQFLMRHKAGVLVGLVLLPAWVLLGYLLFYLLVVRQERRLPSLIFSSVDDLDNRQILTVPKGNSSFRIALGEGQAGDVSLPVLDLPLRGYVVTVKKTATLRRVKWRFLAGYLALLPNQNRMQVTAAAEAPGYLKVKGNLTSTAHLNVNEVFDTAGYRFTYAVPASLEHLNLLERKDSYWQF